MKVLPPCSKLDYETPLYKGCGNSELITITFAAGCFWLPVALVSGYSVFTDTHALFLAFVVFTVGTIFSVAVVAHIKHWLLSGKPDDWHRKIVYCAIHPILSSNLVYKSGCWSSVRKD